MSFKHINKSKELSKIRATAAAAAMKARWGEPRGKSRQVRVDLSAAAALESVPERDRREVASRGIETAVKFYHAHR